MTATLLDGKAIANQIQAELTHEVAAFVDRQHIKPCLAAVLVGEDPASQVYVRNKSRGCEGRSLAAAEMAGKNPRPGAGPNDGTWIVIWFHTARSLRLMVGVGLGNG